MQIVITASKLDLAIKVQADEGENQPDAYTIITILGMAVQSIQNQVAQNSKIILPNTPRLN